jgi:four helix bundle protein
LAIILRDNFYVQVLLQEQITRRHADFIHKMQIVLKEIRESMYWLKLIERTQLMKEDGIKKIIKETEEISNIVGKSIITAKRNRNKK